MKKEIIQNLIIPGNLDITLLREQRDMLLNRIDKWSEPDYSDATQDLCEGILNLLDCILDEAEGYTCMT
jgi:hypothetical protein